MNKALNARITRHLTLQWIKENFLLIVALPVVIGAAAFLTLSYPVSQRSVDARFLRWTVDQSALSNYGIYRAVVYCDLPDGRTVMAIAGSGWQPLKAGEMIAVTEYTMVWGGLRYRIP